MARKRMIDPEFWSDEEVGQWSFAARLFYIGLWNFADDEGRFKAHNQLLKSQIFPYDRHINIEKLKVELINKIQWYNDGQEDSQYGFIHNFLKYQKIDKPYPSKLPPPPEVKIDEHSANGQGIVLPKIKEEKIKEDNIYTPEFETFWSSYPKKVGKGKTYEFWRKLKPSAELQVQILLAVEQQKTCAQWRKENGQFIPNPATWLNQRRFDDTGIAKPEPQTRRTCAVCNKPAYTHITGEDKDYCSDKCRYSKKGKI